MFDIKKYKYQIKEDLSLILQVMKDELKTDTRKGWQR
jgi:hypothetical protein